MSVLQIQHSRWGNNLSNQLSVASALKGGDGDSGYTTTVVKNFFGGERLKQKFVGLSLQPASDNDRALREFRHRCGLMKIMLMSNRCGSFFVAFLDGHCVSDFKSSDVEFRFAKDELDGNDGNPMAEIWFRGVGKRHGPLDLYGTTRLICTFADKKHMEQYLDLTNQVSAHHS
jgi:hypothetical protein